MQDKILNCFCTKRGNKCLYHANLPKKYKVIYADPPWSYKSKNPTCKIEKQPETCSVNYYYNTMKLDDIKNLPISNIAEKDSILFLWATTPMIKESLEVMGSWGFKYKTMITWEKTNNDCMGYWFRVCTEHLLVGVKGKIDSFRSMERTCYHEKRSKHSKKPIYFTKLISSLFSKDNKIELFAREKKDGWDVWGNEVKSDIKL